MNAIDRAKLRRIDKLLSKLPKLACKQKCQEACGPIAMSRLEHRRIEEAGLDTRPLADLTCPLLGADGLCKIYEIRPTICRLFGLVKKMQCPHGCVPERWVSDAEAHELLKKINDICEGN